MAELQQFDRLRALSQRNRWIVGLKVDARLRSVRAALIGVEGSGLAARVEVFATTRHELGREIRRLYRRLTINRARSAADAAYLAALVAECQASLLQEFAVPLAPVWHRVLAVAVDDPGLWNSERGLTARIGLCDAARLADLSGLNVIDAFADRDLAQQGQGGPLAPIPHWILLHHPQATRLLVEIGCNTRLTYLPGTRDTAGAARVAYCAIADTRKLSVDQLAGAIIDNRRTHFPPSPDVAEFVLRGRGSAALARELRRALPEVTLRQPMDLGIPAKSVSAAVVAVLGLLVLDQTPANVTSITGAEAPRVLGRLTPGAIGNWHRLVREMAAARPSVVSLRSAI